MIEAYQDNSAVIYHGSALDVLRELPADYVQCVVTSPPYFGLRDYGVKPSQWGDYGHCGHMKWERSGSGKQCSNCGSWIGALGLEPTFQLYLHHLEDIFSEIWRVMRNDGTLWLNLGDSYYGGNKGNSGPLRPGDKQGTNIGSWSTRRRDSGTLSPTRSGGCPDLKVKDIIGIPWRVAFALQAAGWYLRSDIIWSKPNPMPESVTDRPTKSHEYVFLLSKNERYYFNADAVRSPFKTDDGNRNVWPQGWATEGSHRAVDHAQAKSHKGSKFHTGKTGVNGNGRVSEAEREDNPKGRNIRSVWTIATQPYPEAHFATFPEDLVKPCVLAGSRPGDIVMDPFAGSGTALYVAKELGRKAIGIELNQDYIGLAAKRLSQEVLPFSGKPAKEGMEG